MKRYAFLSMVTFALFGCGGSDGGSDSSAQAAPSAIEGTIDSVSTTTVTVNGYTYQATSASFQGQTFDQDMLTLEPNMMVKVSNQYRATNSSVELEPTFIGQIESINRLNSTFSIAGVNLKFPRLSTNIVNGDWVMVSSMPTANAGYKVLSVVKFLQDPLDGEMVAEGRVSALDTNSLSFKIGSSLTISFDPRVVQDKRTLADGMWVEVQGQYDESNGELIPSRITIKTYNDFPNDGEIEGIVTWVAKDKSEFELNYRGRIAVRSNTEFDDGNKNNLLAGALVEVEIGKQGNALYAKEIEFEDDFDFDIDWDQFEFEEEGRVTNIDSNTHSFTINGKAIVTDAYTEYENRIDFESLNGECVDVEGIVIDSKHIAREISLEDDCID
ncbi:DUF5666 domain-containing protein [Enterovibrio norvegicus]|uniref:DUF5666 domain-containing protein n=1 Tax=Enterovibrio norvegicus DSM 15893 TaxID=1121869 RepID=A0A1I5JGE4_9GAMM|nr:DUF5666 domain-containing protein [Enterovibrio norvegicus]SFO71623.1 hypothetical protein SAMN03084138_00167 [Enterovibrio norvegicus DSM 15893]